MHIYTNMLTYMHVYMYIYHAAAPHLLNMLPVALLLGV